MAKRNNRTLTSAAPNRPQTTLAELQRQLEECTRQLAEANLTLQRERAERSQVETALHQSEEQFKSIFDNAIMGLYRSTPQGQILMANPALLEMMGFASFEELTQRNLEQDGFDEDSPRVAFKRQLEQEGQVIGLEAGWVRRDGRVLYVRENARAIRDEAGHILYYEGTVEDITGRKQAEEQARQAGALQIAAQQLSLANAALEKEIAERQQAEADLLKFKLGIECSSDAIFLTDINGVITYANPAFEKIYGYTREETIGQTPRLIKSGFIPPEGYQHFWATLLAKGSVTGEIVNKAKDGRLVHIAGNNHPIIDEQENIIGFLATHHDITEQKQAEAALAKRAAELETVAQVGAATAAILDTNRLLQEVVDLTRSSFNLYHAHIYLVDELGQTLHLAAGAGQVGQQMMAQGWHISLAKEHSLVARAARTGQGVMANNVRQAPDWLPNPLLPETQAELAVPLIVGDITLGVLDVQAAAIDHFTNQDVQIMTILAGQVAIALKNAEQYQQTQKALAKQQDTSQLLEKRMREQACLSELGREIAETPPIPELLQWAAERIPPAMQYPALCQAAIEYKGQFYGQPEAITQPCQMAHALRLDGQVMGRVYIAYTQKHDFLDEESALIGGIAGRLSGYLENRRLVEQAQQRAAELEETTRFMDSIIENLPVMLFVKEAKELRFVRWNRAGQALLGLKAADMIGKNDYDFFPPEEADFFTAKDRETLNGGQLIDIPEEPIQTADKGIRWLNTRKVPIYGADGQPKYLLGISVDITERRQAEQTIAQQNELLDKIINHIPIGVFAKDAQNDYRFTIWNKKMEEILGVKSEAMLGKNDYDFSEKELADQYRQVDMAVIEKGQLVDTPVEEIVTAQGVHRLAHTIKLPILDSQGHPQLLFGVLEDITEREQIMQTLALLNKVVESSPAIMFRWRAAENWPVEYVSKNVSQFGYTPAELISGLVPYSSIVHPDDLERVGREVMDFATRGLDQFAQEYRIIGRDGQIHWTDDRTVVERDRNGHITYYQGIVLDITERKQAELERERLLAEVEAAYRQYVRHEWQAYLNQQHQGDWRVEHQPTTSALVSSGNGQNNSALTTPLILQGQVIGNISLEDVDPHRQWSGEELALVEAVSQQLALTVENLRLFEDTQRLAAREQITRQITEKMRAAPDFESIIRVGIQEIARVLGSSHVLVELNTDDNKGIGL